MGALTVTRKLLILATGIVLLFAGSLWRLRASSAQDPYAIAKAFRSAVLKGDVDAMLRVMSEEELRDNRMSKEDLRRFVNEWLRPRLRQEFDASEDVFGSGATGDQTFTGGLTTREGGLRIGTSVAKTDQGLRVVRPLSSMFVTFAGIKPTGLSAKGADKLKTYEENARRFAPQLAAYRFTRIRLSPESDPITLDEFVAWNRERRQRFEADSARRSREGS